MNSLFFSLGIESWKPVLTGLLMPPVPLLLLILLGAGLLAKRRRFGGVMVWVGVVGIWLGSSVAPAEWLLRSMAPASLQALGLERIAELKRDSEARRSVAIVVLGGGREVLAPEYGTSSLSPYTLERLRYGLWLGREIGAPVGFAGGIGHGAKPGPSEAEIASRIAAREFERPLQWTEGASRDTRENGLRMIALLRGQPIDTIVLVTHAAHMQRSLRAFEDAAVHAEMPVRIVPAPMALAPRSDHPLLRWVPSTEGFMLARYVMREKIGLWMGA